MQINNPVALIGQPHGYFENALASRFRQAARVSFS